ncbi:MAG: hypothetical protein IH851_06510 [Armatimonadetes bacterium]|nr:hypothetical protein [Armatimonadota bacterium]
METGKHTGVRVVRLAVAALVVLPAAWGQDGLSGPGRFEQFRGPSGLPGSVVGVRFDGSPGAGGALTLSTPVGVALGGGHWVAGVGGVSKDLLFRIPWPPERVGSSENNVNGHAWLLYGLDTASGRVALGAAFPHGGLPVSFNAQWELPTPRDLPLRVSVGVQDPFSDGAVRGLGERTDSYFAAATAKAGSIYATTGVGTGRFKEGFMSVSAPLGGLLRATVEHDGFGWNFGASVVFLDRFHLFAGVLGGRHAVLAGAVSF